MGSVCAIVDGAGAAVGGVCAEMDSATVVSASAEANHAGAEVIGILVRACALQEGPFRLDHFSRRLEEGRVLNVFLLVILTQVTINRTHFPGDGAGLVLAPVQLRNHSYVARNAGIRAFGGDVLKILGLLLPFQVRLKPQDVPVSLFNSRRGLLGVDEIPIFFVSIPVGIPSSGKSESV